MTTVIRTAFNEGVKSTVDPTIIPENSIWRSLNARSDVNGILRIREGAINLFPLLGQGNFQALTEAFGKIHFIWNNQLMRYDKETNLVENATDITIPGTDDKELQTLNWTSGGKEALFIFGGENIYLKESGFTSIIRVMPYVPTEGEEPNLYATVPNIAKAKYVTLRASLSQRVAVAGVPGAPNTVYLSAPLDISYFPVSQVIQLPDDGNEITGITNWYNALIIFRTNDIWAFFGTDLNDSAAALVLQDSSVGCIAPKTITHVPDVGVCFVGPDNIYALQGVSGVENQAKAVPIGDDIVNFVQKAIDDDVENATAIYYNRELRICFPNALQNERVFRFSIQNTRGWYIDSGPATSHYLVYDGELYGSYFNIGTIHRITRDSLYDETIYDNTSIPFSVTFRRENLQPGPARIKRIFLYVMNLGKLEDRIVPQFGTVFNKGTFNARSSDFARIEEGTEQNFDVSIIVDGNEFKIDNLKIVSKKMEHAFISRSEPVRIYEAIIRPSLKGHFAQIKLDAKEPGQLIAVLGYGIDYQQKGRIRGIREGVTNNKDW